MASSESRFGALTVALAASALGHGAVWLGLAEAPDRSQPKVEPVFVRFVEPVTTPMVAPEPPTTPVLVAASTQPAKAVDRPPVLATRPATAAKLARVHGRTVERRVQAPMHHDGIGGPHATQAATDNNASMPSSDNDNDGPALSAGPPLSGAGDPHAPAGPAMSAAEAPSSPAMVDLGSYASRVREAILAHRHYPPLAARQALEGTVVLRVRSRPDGRLAEPPLVMQSSGHASLDDAAIGFVTAAVPLPAAPAGAPAIMEFHVPLRFALDDDG